ncbi:hypothetical protein AB0F07_33920 [Streptomyces fructofermentans]|uniref:hypothetical protein n=1 Tax=Streptomyces fructofermentans TaxID=152141 RepID=UPI0034091036
MSEHLSLIDPQGPNGPAPSWSFVPPRAVRRRFYGRIANLRRPPGTLALPAVAATATLYFTDVLPHADAPMALGLTGLVVLYDSVIAVCRTWHATGATAAASRPRTATAKRAV